MALSIKLLKTQSLQVLICSLLQAKHLVITQEKDDGSKDGPFLSFATKCKGRATYDLNVEAILLQLGKAVAAASSIAIDVLNLDIVDGAPAAAMTEL